MHCTIWLGEPPVYGSEDPFRPSVSSSVSIVASPCSPVVLRAGFHNRVQLLFRPIVAMSGRLYMGSAVTWMITAVYPFATNGFGASTVRTELIVSYLQTFWQ